MKVRAICLVDTYDKEILNYKERLAVELVEEDIEIVKDVQDKVGKHSYLVAVEYETTKKKSDTANNKKQAELNDKIREATDEFYTEDNK
jgi:hypothetical protein